MTATRLLLISALIASVVVAPAQERSAISYAFENARLSAACDTLVRRFGLPLVYLDTLLQAKTVSASCTGCTDEEALTALLAGTGITWRRSAGQYVLLRLPRRDSAVTGTVSGVVRDSVTGEGIAGATIILAGDSSPALPRLCIANRYGFFALRRVTPGIYRLSARCVGYATASRLVVVPDPGSVEIQLAEEHIRLREVVVEGRADALAAADGLSHGVYVPSVPSEQHQYLLDGAAVYNPAHFGGVLSAFSPDALRDVEVKPGGLPPAYGGRIGGVLDLSVRDGTMEGIAGSAAAGSLGSHLTLEGPLAGATTFMISGRRGHPDLFRPPDEPERKATTLNSAELLAKLTVRLSPQSRLSVSGYIDDDGYSNAVTGQALNLSNHLSWSNASANVQWTGVASSSLFLQASAGYTSYAFDMEHILEDSLIAGQSGLRASSFRIEDAHVRADAEHFYDDEHTLRAGVALVHHVVDAGIDPFSLQIGSLALRQLSVWEASLYLQDQWRILPDVTAELGVRTTSFQGDAGVFSGVEPRFSLLVRPEDGFRVTFGLTSVTEYMHPYRQSGVFLFYPTLFWYPSTDTLLPTSLLHLSLGADRDVAGGAVMLSTELFYGVTRNLHEFALTTETPPDVPLAQQAFLGTGTASGVRLGVRGEGGWLAGSVSYTLAWATHRFSGLNGGEAYVPRFNRRHEVEANARASVARGWTLGFIAVVASDQSPSFAPKVAGKEVVGGVAPSDMNGSRLAGFQRVEFQLAHFFAAFGLAWQAEIRLLNDYGMFDPFVWSLRRDPDPRLGWQASLEEPTLTPRNVAVNLAVRF